ncbi:MAG: hypothetical protein Q9160_006012 [Pyrenula sp. 1 TL-2023]
MARLAHAALSAQPRATEVEDLYRKLFQPNEQARNEVLRVLQGVDDKVPANSQPGTNREDPNEVIIFCDYSRIVVFEDRPYDPALDLYVDDDDDFRVCSSTSGVSFAPLAVTYHLDDDDQDGRQRREPPNVMQLCPWFVQLIKDKKYPTLDLPSLKNFAANSVIAALKAIGIITQIDIFALLDHVILHEMTHVKGIGTRDIGDLLEPYFWPNVQVEKKGDQAQNNAGVDLIVHHNTVVEKSGQLKPAQSLLQGGSGIHQDDHTRRLIRRLLKEIRGMGKWIGGVKLRRF